MKHTAKITLILVLIFLFAQIIGLVITESYLDKDLPLGIERPEVEESSSFAYILAAILIGTMLLLLLIRFKKVNLWRIWFLLAVTICLAISFSAFMGEMIALGLAILLGLYKIFKPNVLVHNVTEIFIYGGLAAIFVPIMNMFAIIMLLLLISVYDMYAVWKSKHMIKLAQFQSSTKVFAGLSIPYKLPKKGEIKKVAKKDVKVKKGVKTAILGGGDIGFPLMFAGVVMKELLSLNVEMAFLKVMIIPIATTIALSILFIKSEKNKFYPAMPFLTIGCFVGYGILLLII